MRQAFIPGGFLAQHALLKAIDQSGESCLVERIGVLQHQVFSPCIPPQQGPSSTPCPVSTVVPLNIRVLEPLAAVDAIFRAIAGGSNSLGSGIPCRCAARRNSPKWISLYWIPIRSKESRTDLGMSGATSHIKTFSSP
jgi:hypothetical protein